MKKLLLLVLLVLIGLQTQAQFIPNLCDSISYTTLPQQTLTVIGNSSLSPNMVDSITWSWQACNSTTCYSGSGQTATFQNILSTDTVKVCYDAYIYFAGATYICTGCDSLVYNPNTYQWEATTAQPLSITELPLNTINDGRMYDLLGREIFEAPIGTMYIRNNKKHIRR